MSVVLPEFREPGSYIRYYGASVFDPVADPQLKTRFIRLNDREGPLRYPFKISTSSVAQDTLAGEATFSDLEPARNHVFQVFLGVHPGAYFIVSNPQDARILKWDIVVAPVAPLQVSEAVTGVITYKESPVEAPQFELWIAPGKQYPKLDALIKTQELVGVPKSIRAGGIWYAMRYRYTSIDPRAESEIYDMLSKHKIPSFPMTFGGTSRETVR